MPPPFSRPPGQTTTTVSTAALMFIMRHKDQFGCIFRQARPLSGMPARAGMRLGRRKKPVRLRLTLNPGVRFLEPVDEGLRRCPAELLLDQSVIRISSANTQRAGNMALLD